MPRPVAVGGAALKTPAAMLKSAPDNSPTGDAVMARVGYAGSIHAGRSRNTTAG
jgi:hypothetical protein